MPSDPARPRGLLVLVFLTGAAVLSLEILGTRLISPFYGATIFVWSSLVTATLAALALGYAAGGVLADRVSATPAPHGALLLRLGRLLGAAGLWLVLVPLMRGPVLALSEPLGVRWGSFLAAVVLLGPPLAALGAAGPLVVRMKTAGLSEAGREVGGVAAVSTLGSVAGALLTGFYLLPRVPIRVSLGVQAFLVLAAAAACFQASRKTAAAGVLAVLAAAGGAWTALRVPPSPGFVRERGVSFYGNLRVIDAAGSGRRVLYIDGIPNTVVDIGTLDSTSDYITSFEFLPFYRPGARRALLIGMGGGSLVARYRSHYGVTTDVVEIDPEIARLARKWFAFSPSGPLHFEDGRRFLERGRASLSPHLARHSGASAPLGHDAYDFIVIDAFNGDQHPYHLFSVEAFRAAKARLRPEGILALNVIGYAVGPRAGLLRAVAATLREVFPEVKAFAANRDIDPNASYVNLTLMASDAPLEFRKDIGAEARPDLRAYYGAVKGQFLPLEGGAPVTDDRNPVEELGAAAFVEIRRRLFETNRALLLD